jgi:hypothetical protein
MLDWVPDPGLPHGERELVVVPAVEDLAGGRGRWRRLLRASSPSCALAGRRRCLTRASARINSRGIVSPTI